MGKKVEVILMDDVEGLGKKGDRKTVPYGYAYNCLIPKGLAVPATEERLNALKEAAAVERRRKEREIRKAKQVVEAISGKEITFEKRAGPSGKLFGAVTASDIAAELSKIAPHKVDKRHVLLEKPIKEPGEHAVRVRVLPEIETEVKVKVVPVSGR